MKYLILLLLLPSVVLAETTSCVCPDQGAIARTVCCNVAYDTGVAKDPRTCSEKESDCHQFHIQMWEEDQAALIELRNGLERLLKEVEAKRMNKAVERMGRWGNNPCYTSNSRWIDDTSVKVLP